MLNPISVGGEHVLNTMWSLWYDDQPSMMESYGETMKEIYTFHSVENFWRLYHNIVKASELRPESTYFLFRRGIEPKWEDLENQNGGRWTHYYSFSRSSSPQRQSRMMMRTCSDFEKEQNQLKNERDGIEEKWIDTLLACIGEDFPMSQYVKGCVFTSKKNQMRISLWVNCKDDKRANKLIGQKFKMILGLENEKIVFHYHQNEGATGCNSIISL